MYDATARSIRDTADGPIPGPVRPPSAPSVTVVVDAAFRSHERFLRTLCYRMTGSLADAEDVVQDTFARALERPPARLDEPLRPWLARVATRLACDHLRRRRRRPYTGPWLPEPYPDDDEPPAYEPVFLADDGQPVTAAGRYDLIESLSFAFLMALEALTPRQRAVLILRDVFDYSVERTAAALDVRVEVVKTTLHRARRAMASYDRGRLDATSARRTAAANVMARFIRAVATDDATAAEALLAPDVTALSDGGGRYFAARRPIVGARKVARFFAKITRSQAIARARIALVNGLPALIAEVRTPDHRRPPITVILAELDARGRIARLYTVTAPAKLRAF